MVVIIFSGVGGGVKIGVYTRSNGLIIPMPNVKNPPTELFTQTDVVR